MNLTRLSPFTMIQVSFVDRGSSSPQGLKYKNALGQEVYPRLEILNKTNTSCRYLELDFFLANSISDPIKIHYFEYFDKMYRPFQIEVIQPTLIAMITSFDQNLNPLKEQYNCLSQIAYRVEKFYGNTLSCHSSYENLLIPIDQFFSTFSRFSVTIE